MTTSFPRVLSPQAFEAEHLRDGVMLIPREESLLILWTWLETALLV
jgi:hypothetical protein